MRRFIKRFAGYVSERNGYAKDLEEQVEYALRILIFETLKILGIILIYSLLGHPVEAIEAVCVMSMIKPFIGGYHEESQLSCFAAALAIVGSVIYLGSSINIDIISRLIFCAVSLFCIWQQAPVINDKMPLKREDLIRRNRNVGLLISAVFICITIIFSTYKRVSDPVLWTVVFQALLMFNKGKLKTGDEI